MRLTKSTEFLRLAAAIVAVAFVATSITPIGTVLFEEAIALPCGDCPLRGGYRSPYALAPGSRFEIKGEVAPRETDPLPPEGVIPLKKARWQAIEKALYAAKGDVLRAEKLIGISKSAIYRLLKAHGKKSEDYAISGSIIDEELIIPWPQEEERRMKLALRRANWNYTLAARWLRIFPMTLYKKILPSERPAQREEPEDLEPDQLSLGKYFQYLNDTLREIKALAQNKYRYMPIEQLKEEARRLKSGPEGSAPLERVLIEAFAIFKAASDRLMPEVNPNYTELHDEQILAAMSMATGYYTKEKIKKWVLAEQASGEGKTLTIAMVAYLWALKGEGVHIGTFNDYLAMRDCMQMGRIYDLLGMRISAIKKDGSNLMYDALIKPNHMRQYWDTQRRNPITRRDAYNADITYGWWASFAHDYLYDSVQSDAIATFQRGFNALILDEADDPLADEARVPLVIAEAIKISAEERSGREKRFYGFREFASRLIPDKDFVINKRERTIALSKGFKGQAGDEAFIINALVAKYILRKNVDYVVKEVEEFVTSTRKKRKVKRVIVIDRPTGRQLPLHTWDDGLHEAVEAENNLEIRDPSRDVASTNFRDYFNKYKLRAAITATAKPIKDEVRKRYGLCYIPFPLHELNRRIDLEDVVFRTKEEKWQFVAERVKGVIQAQVGPRPVLVGTTSIEDSLTLNRIFKENQIDHALLNGLQDLAKEHEIIEQAGRVNPKTDKGNATLATNMAGRGTDIIPDQISLQNGGLFVIGTEHYESERQDDQLRGRPARQGQPGSSVFITSLEDEIIQRFADPELLRQIQNDLADNEGGPIHHPRLKELIATAQFTASDYYRSLRDHTLSCFHVRDVQRALFYKLRQRLIEGEKILEDEAALDELIKYGKGALRDTDIYTDEAVADYGLNKKAEALTSRRSLANFAKMAEKNLLRWRRDVDKRHIILEMLNLYWRDYAELLEEIEKDILHHDHISQKKREEAVDRYREITLSSGECFVEGLRQFQIWHKGGAVSEPIQESPNEKTLIYFKRKETIRSFFEKGIYDLRDISKALFLSNNITRRFIRQDWELCAMRDAKLKELIDADETQLRIAAVFGVERVGIVWEWIRSNGALNRAYKERHKHKDEAWHKTEIPGPVRRGKYWATPEQKGVIQRFFEKKGIYNWKMIAEALSVDEYILTNFVIRDETLLGMRNARLMELINRGRSLGEIAGVFNVDIPMMRGWIRFNAQLEEAFERNRKGAPAEPALSTVSSARTLSQSKSMRASNLAPGSRFGAYGDRPEIGFENVPRHRQTMRCAYGTIMPAPLPSLALRESP